MMDKDHDQPAAIRPKQVRAAVFISVPFRKLLLEEFASKTSV
jgi:hypothetical protein